MFLSLQVIIIIAYFHDLKGRIKKLVHVRVCVYVCVCVCVCLIIMVHVFIMYRNRKVYLHSIIHLLEEQLVKCCRTP